MNRFRFLFLLISILLSSCSFDSSDSKSKSFEIVDKESFVENTDVLFIMYMDGDNSLNDTAWENIFLAQIGLRAARTDKITVVALIDGYITSPDDIGNGKSYLLKLGGYDEDEYKYNNNTKSYNFKLVSRNSKDYSQTVNWIYARNHEVDMSSGNTLYYFLTWTKKHFKAQKTILAVQNHGGGPYNELKSSISSRSICWDDTNHPEDDDSYLSTTDVATAINKTFGKIDMLVEDVCLQCSIEEIYGLQDAVHYMVASPNTTYGNTYNYDKIIPYASFGASIEEIGKLFIEKNKEYCINETYTLRKSTTLDFDPTCMELSLTLVDCSKSDVLENIKKHTSELAEAIMSADFEQKRICINSIGFLPKNTTETIYGFCYKASFSYTNDIGLMSYILANSSAITDTKIKTAAQNLFSDLKNNNLIVAAWAGGSGKDWYYTGDDSYGSNFEFLKITDEKCPWGISITANRGFSYDKDGKITKYNISLENYSNWSKFAKDNKWADLLKTYKNSLGRL